MTSNTDMHLLVTYTSLKKVGVWIRKLVSIWCDHHLPHAARHLLHIEFIWLSIVACGMFFHSSSMDMWSCWMLAGTGTRCRTRRPQSISNMLNGWHVWRVCKPWKNRDMFCIQELCLNPCDMGSCIIMLKHEVMAVDEWHDNGPQDLVTVFLCIQIAFNGHTPT